MYNDNKDVFVFVHFSIIVYIVIKVVVVKWRMIWAIVYMYLYWYNVIKCLNLIRVFVIGWFHTVSNVYYDRNIAFDVTDDIFMTVATLDSALDLQQNEVWP